MHIPRAFSLTAGLVLALAVPFGASTANAATLSCVQRAMAWPTEKDLTVSFTAVALHSSSVASYTTGPLINSTCGRAPYALGRVGCLVTPGWVNALLSDRTFWTPSQQQPFDVSKPLLLSVDEIPLDTLAQVHMHQPNATYDFDARCVGDLLVGDDQWGNHWTISFRLIDSRLR
jgi:hypothetical protein